MTVLSRAGASRTRVAVRLVLGAVALAAGLGAWGLQQVLVVGVGHKAKVLCSGIFVSGRQPEAVEAGLQVDDLAVLRHIRATVDREAGSVTASTFGLVTRRAVHREGLGCALALDGLEPPRLSAGPGAPTAPADLPVRPGSAALQQAVASAFDEPNQAHPRRTSAVVIVQHGSIVAEQYAADIGPATPLPGWSMAKSVTNALVGVLVHEGRLSLHAPAPVPEWHQPGDPRAMITIDHLLRMSSGLRFDEGMSSPRSDIMRMLFNAADVGRFAVDRKLDATPGSRWQYSSATTNILSRIIRNVIANDEAYLTLPRRALFDPLGMSSAVMETDATGTFVASSYVHASARGWARFGLLYLNDGVVHGVRVLPEGWVAYSTAPTPADPSSRYGAHFWVQVPEGYAGADPGLPVPAFHAAGHEGQFVTIVPSYDAVIVRIGRTRYPDAWDHAAFVRNVLPALEPGRRQPASDRSPPAEDR